MKQSKSPPDDDQRRPTRFFKIDRMFRQTRLNQICEELCRRMHSNLISALSPTESDLMKEN
jgi:hypothetical protein